jgi:hypothetical protein
MECSAVEPLRIPAKLTWHNQSAWGEERIVTCASHKVHFGLPRQEPRDQASICRPWNCIIFSAVPELNGRANVQQAVRREDKAEARRSENCYSDARVAAQLCCGGLR